MRASCSLPRALAPCARRRIACAATKACWKSRPSPAITTANISRSKRRASAWKFSASELSSTRVPRTAPTNPRWRAIAALSAPQSKEAHSRLAARLDGALGGILAHESRTLSQPYYYGRVNGHEYKHAESHGRHLDECGELDDLIQEQEKEASACHQKEQQSCFVTPDQVRELRAALCAMRADDRVLWVRMGHALKTIGDQGRALWLEWSQTSEKYDAGDASVKWDSFRPTTTDYRAVFAEAMKHGWQNPRAGSDGDAKAKPPVALSDFWAYMPTHQCIFVPTREMWPAGSVDKPISDWPQSFGRKVHRPECLDRLGPPRRPNYVAARRRSDPFATASCRCPAGCRTRAPSFSTCTARRLASTATRRRQDRGSTTPISFIPTTRNTSFAGCSSYSARRRKGQSRACAGRHAGHRQGHLARARGGWGGAVELAGDQSHPNARPFQRLDEGRRCPCQRIARSRRRRSFQFLRSQHDLLGRAPPTYFVSTRSICASTTSQT